MTGQIMPSDNLILAGRERRLVIDFNAQAAFEKATGLSIFDKKVLRPQTTPLVTRAMLWAALLHDDEQVRFDEFGHMTEPPELSMQAVGKLINRKNVNEINRKVFNALKLFFQEEEENRPSKKNEDETTSA
jgi:hypothetical protein